MLSHVVVMGSLIGPGVHKSDVGQGCGDRAGKGVLNLRQVIGVAKYGLKGSSVKDKVFGFKEVGGFRNGTESEAVDDVFKSSGLFQVSVSLMSDTVKGGVDDSGVKVRIGVEGDKLDAVFATASGFPALLGRQPEKKEKTFCDGGGPSQLVSRGVGRVELGLELRGGIV